MQYFLFLASLPTMGNGSGSSTINTKTPGKQWFVLGWQLYCSGVANTVAIAGKKYRSDFTAAKNHCKKNTIAINIVLRFSIRRWRSLLIPVHCSISALRALIQRIPFLLASLFSRCHRHNPQVWTRVGSALSSRTYSYINLCQWVSWILRVLKL